MDTKEKRVTTGIPEENQAEIKSIMKYGKKAKGQAALIKYLKGDVLTAKNAIIAKCYECMNYYADGVHNCKLTTCPLFLFNPYNKVGIVEEVYGGDE